MLDAIQTGPKSTANPSQSTSSAVAVINIRDARMAAVDAGLKQEFGPIMETIKNADSLNATWRAIQGRADYGRLLLRTRFAAQSGDPQGQMVIESIARQTGLNEAELTELKSFDLSVVRQGQWVPQTTRAQQLASKSKEVKPFDPTQDAVTRTLDKLSRATQPRVLEGDIGAIPVVGSGVKGIYKLIDRALPYIELEGEIYATDIDKFAVTVENLGAKLSTEIQSQYRQMHQALKPLGVKESAVKELDTIEQQMILQAGAAIRDIAVDIDAWIDILNNPELRNNEGFMGKAKAATRYTLESLADLLKTSASFLRGVTSAEGWRLCTVNAVGGGGLMVATCCLGGGIGVFVPSLEEVRRSGKVMGRMDFAVPSVTTPIGGAMLSSRGGKWNIKTPLVGVRRSEYSQAVKFGIPFLFGISVHRDKVYGSGVELSIFPKFGVTGVFDIRGGGNVVVFHPGLRGLDRPVAAIADKVGDGMDWLADHVRMITRPIAKITRSALEKIGWLKPKAAVVQAAVVQQRSLLGRKLLTVERATRSLGQIDSYLTQLDSGVCAQSLMNNPAFEKLARNTDPIESLETIRGFLGKQRQRLSDQLGDMAALVETTHESPLAARNQRKNIRALARKMNTNVEVFNFVDQVLCQLIDNVAPSVAGPFAPLFIDGQSQPQSQQPLTQAAS